MSETGRETKAAEASRLYWETDESVASIAERLELSRRALYDAVRPQPAGRTCPQCGTGMVHENRSARNADNAVCLHCEGTEETPVSVQPLAEAAAEPDLVRFGAAALLGATAGAIATLLFIRRR